MMTDPLEIKSVRIHRASGVTYACITTVTGTLSIRLQEGFTPITGLHQYAAGQHYKANSAELRARMAEAAADWLYWHEAK